MPHTSVFISPVAFYSVTAAFFAAAVPLTATAKPAQRGVTLIEALVVVIILALLVAVALPSLDRYVDRERVKMAAEEIYGLVRQAKAEGPIRDQNLSLTINPDAWCLGFAATSGCDCTVSAGEGACTIEVAGSAVRQVVDSQDYPHITISSTFPSQHTTFNRLRGNASPGGSITVESGAAKADIRVAVSGRVRLCRRDGSSALPGYPPC